MKRAIVTIFFLSILALLAYQGVSAAITLVYFTATSQENGILIEWETATEYNNSGYYVTRSTNPAASYDTISPFIPAEGDGPLGAQYEFLDDDVVNGVLYFYILEAFDTNQGVETHGPITATFSGQVSTPTPTITNTPTASKTSKTSTPTSTRTPTATRTPIPTRTYTPAPPTLTPTPTHTETPIPSSTFTVVPSPTLLDAPAIVLQLPSNTDTPFPTLDILIPSSPTNTPTPTGLLDQLAKSSTTMVIGGICLLVLVWAAIAVAVFIYLQKRNS